MGSKLPETEVCTGLREVSTPAAHTLTHVSPSNFSKEGIKKDYITGTLLARRAIQGSGGFTDLTYMRKIALLFLGLTVACTETKVETVVAPTPSELPPVVVVEPPKETKPTLAELKAFVSRVTYRREKEMNWQEAVLNIPFYRFDSVNTHEKSTAQIGFTNGSTVDMTENSLLIINPGAEVTNWDRLLLRKGNLSAKTQKELWILTTAALVRMKPAREKTIARTKIAIEEGKKLQVVLEEGEGTMFETKSPGNLEDAKPSRLVVNKPVIMAAPVVANDFGTAEEVSWPTPEKVDETERTIASVPPPAKPNLTPPDFTITSPSDYSEVSTSSVTLKGKVRGQGVTSLLVNGKTITLGPKQDFAAAVSLNKGANAILIQLNRTEGTPVFRRWTVIRR